ncbi:MAG TPA: sigma-70 family RNA polymerase sigma factor [Candidatus Limnocylindrales bacterium]
MDATSPTQTAGDIRADLRPALATDLDAAFPAFVAAETSRIYGVALRLTGRPADAEDLAQETLIRAYRALAAWDDDRILELAVRPWLASIVVNLARNRARARSSRPATVRLMAELAHPQITLRETPHGSLERREIAETWAARLRALPERYRAPLVLRHVDGLSYDEIADALDRPAGTVKAQVHRGIAMLRTALDAENANDLTSTTSPAPQRAPQEATR